MKYSLIVILSVVIGMNIGHLLTKEHREVDPRVYVPGMKQKQKITIWHLMGLGNSKSPAYIAKEKSRLKQLGTTVAMYFTDGGDRHYPKNPQAFEMDESLFRNSHLSGKYIEVSKDWKIPDSWAAFNNSNSPFVFLWDENKNYKGAAETPMFITRYGYQAGENFYQVVYEDGHVGPISFSEAVILWKQAGVWNGN